MILLSANNATSTLAAGIGSGATTIALSTGTGSLFPAPGLNEYFTLTLNDVQTGALYEVCWCTARTGDSLTVMRGQESTSARAWLIGDYAFNTDTANSINTSRAFSACNGLTLPFSIPPEQNGVVQLCSNSGTITLPAVAGIQDGFFCPIVCVDGAIVTVNTNSATVALPSGNVTSTFQISGAQNTVLLQWSAVSAAWFALASSGNHGFQAFTSGGSFTVPAAIVEVTVVGGGGGATGANPNGGGAGNYLSGAGGGAGGLAKKRITGLTIGATIAVTVAAGGPGAGTTDGGGSPVTANPGGTSSFGSYVSATGGGGGGWGAPTTSAGGGPGAGVGGDVNSFGGYGSDGQAGVFTGMGNGGSSFFGSGGRAASGQNGYNGAAYGSGGGGSYGFPFNGGNGAPGIVMVEW